MRLIEAVRYLMNGKVKELTYGNMAIALDEEHEPARLAFYVKDGTDRKRVTQYITPEDMRESWRTVFASRGINVVQPDNYQYNPLLVGIEELMLERVPTVKLEREGKHPLELNMVAIAGTFTMVERTASGVLKPYMINKEDVEYFEPAEVLK